MEKLIWDLTDLMHSLSKKNPKFTPKEIQIIVKSQFDYVYEHIKKCKTQSVEVINLGRYNYSEGNHRKWEDHKAKWGSRSKSGKDKSSSES
jgi:nucleoid DNA-binding protein